MRVADRNPRTLEGSTFNGNTALHIASVHGHTDFAVTICALCPSLLLRLNSRGDTALHIAAKAGHLALVAELIDCAERMGFKGQMLRMTNAEKNTVLHEAVRHRNHKLVDLLIEKDRDLVFVPNKAESSALHVAAEEGDVKSVQDILNVTKDALNASWRGPKGLTPLHAAVLRQQIGNYCLISFRIIITSDDIDMHIPFFLCNLRKELIPLHLPQKSLMLCAAEFGMPDGID